MYMCVPACGCRDEAYLAVHGDEADLAVHGNEAEAVLTSLADAEPCGEAHKEARKTSQGVMSLPSVSRPTTLPWLDDHHRCRDPLDTQRSSLLSLLLSSMAGTRDRTDRRQPLDPDRAEVRFGKNKSVVIQDLPRDHR